MGPASKALQRYRHPPRCIPAQGTTPGVTGRIGGLQPQPGGRSMERSSVLVVLLVLSVMLLSAQHVRAEPAGQGAGGSPAILSFSTPLTDVNRNALIQRTARVPVSWDTTNRPFIANLVFDQVLPDGSALNVELPRPLD